MKKYILIFLFMCAITKVFSQEEILSQKEKTATIDSLCVALEQNYYDTKLCTGLVKLLRENSKNGTFDSIHLPVEFEAKLESIIREYTKDDHFKIIFDEQWVADNAKVKTKDTYLELLEIEKQASKQINYGFREVKILNGNIGYLRFTSFENPEFAAGTLANAMSFLSNTNAMIVDLRNNTGGYTEMMALVCSYFLNTFEDWYLPLTEMKLKKDGKEIIIQNNALGAVGAPKMFKEKLYILTNYRTFSAAEWTSFILKNRKRAIIVGEKTAGGTHPTNQVPISNKFSINIPIGIMLDAVTKTHFEGTGVLPDIEVPAKDALIYAQIDILEKLKDSSNYFSYDWNLLDLKSILNPVSIPTKVLATYIGKYGNIELKMIREKLYSLRQGITTELIPLSSDIFRLNGRDDLRIKIIKENKKIVAIERILEDGTVLRTNRE